MKNKKGLIFVVIAMLLIVGAGIGGTLSWLATRTNPVENTFTYGDINIKLSETTSEYKIVPGQNIPKNPKVTVVSGSENCYIYLKVKEENWPETDVTYSLVNTDWIKFTPKNTSVETNEQYYYYNGSAAQGTEIQILTDNQIFVANTFTKDKIKTVQPKLTITAYAIQKEGTGNDAVTAWDTVNINSNLSTDFVESK